MKTSLFCRLIRMECRLFFTSKAVMTLVLGGIVLYALMYNYMYLPEVVRQVPVAVVDEDCTPQSRAFFRRLSATPQVRIVSRYADAGHAREALKARDVEGVVSLPRGYSRRVATGEDAIYIMWGTTASLLTYASVQEAVTAVSLAASASSAAETSTAFQSASASPFGVVGIPLYNPTGGYGAYLIPAVLMVILFQTMLMATSIRMGTDYTDRYRRWSVVLRPQPVTVRLAARMTLARMCVLVAVYAVMAGFLLAFVPRLFDLPCEADPFTLLVLVGEYLVATAAFALACAPLFRDPEGPLVYLAFFSVGYLFLSGVSWPLEQMPVAWQIVRILFPVCPATQAYVEVSTMGATLVDISSQLLQLSLQAKVYISVAVLGQIYLLKGTLYYEFLKNKDEKQINSSF